jgi:hypothetical protein
MIVLAKGSITEPKALAHYIDDEIRAVGEFKGDGVINAFIGALPDPWGPARRIRRSFAFVNANF